MASVVVALVVVEVYLHLNPPPYIYEATRNVVQQTQSEPSADPILGYLPKANLVGRFRNKEFDTTVRINSNNMRDREYSYEKQAGTKRIVAVGDSFVFGWGVEGNETATEVLEDQYLRQVEVLNMGVSGYCHSQVYERLMTDGIRFSPDIVLFFLYDIPCDDVPPIRFDGDGGAMYWTSVNRTGLWGRTKSFINKNVYLSWLIRRSISTLRATGNVSDDGGEAGKWAIETHVRQSGLVLCSALTELATRSSVRVVLVYVPTKAEILGHVDPLLATWRDTIRNYAETMRLGYVDLSPALRSFMESEHRSPYFVYDDHWNRDGHRVTAKVLAESLKNTYLRPDDYQDRMH